MMPPPPRKCYLKVRQLLPETLRTETLTTSYVKQIGSYGQVDNVPGSQGWVPNHTSISKCKPVSKREDEVVEVPIRTKDGVLRQLPESVDQKNDINHPGTSKRGFFIADQNFDQNQRNKVRELYNLGKNTLSTKKNESAQKPI